MYLIFKALGYILVPYSRIPPAVMSTVITAAVVLFTYKGIKNRNGTTGKSMLIPALMPLFAVIFVIGKAIGYDTDGIELYLLPVYAYIALICAMALFFAYVSERKWRVWLGAAYAILLMPILVIVALWDFGPKPVVGSAMSPNGVYLAEAVISDQGMFGSHTMVRVARQNQDIHLAVGFLRRDAKRVYRGEYGKHETTALQWENDGTLYINGVRFIIE
jgi:hypothetical protein